MITIRVYGLPGPMGSKRFVGTSKAGRGIMVESSKKVKPWREAVRWSAIEAMLRGNHATMDGPLWVSMVFTLPKPKSAPKTRQTWPDRTPDLSKLARSTEDALTDAGVWADDARVVEYTRLAKVFPGEDEESLDRPGALIIISGLADIAAMELAA